MSSCCTIQSVIAPHLNFKEFLKQCIAQCVTSIDTMAGAISLESVKRKIKSLQDQAEVAEDRAERLKQELGLQKKAREEVSMTITYSQYRLIVQTIDCLRYKLAFKRCR